MSIGISRSQFLRGDFSGERSPIRPPWSLPEAQFSATCTGCGDCVAACPRGVIRRGRAGLPMLDFSVGDCDFCAACAQSCKTAALSLARQADAVSPWRVRAELAGECLAQRGVLCRICGDHCEAGAIRFRLSVGGGSKPQIDVLACTGCGACYRPCPTQAIALRDFSVAPS